MKIIFLFSVQQYLNLTGSSHYATLGKAFTLTCRMLKPLEISINYVLIRRNSILCVGIGYVSGSCLINSDNPRYTYGCLSENAYTLTIPADNMTEYEQNSQWQCESIANSSYRSSSIILNIAGTVYSNLSKWFCSVLYLQNPDLISFNEFSLNFPFKARTTFISKRLQKCT